MERVLFTDGETGVKRPSITKGTTNKPDGDVSDLRIVRAWQMRRESLNWRLKEYVRLIQKARQIDLLGLTLATDIFENDTIVDQLAARLSPASLRQKPCKIRVIVSDPTRLAQRRREPGERRAPYLGDLLHKSINALNGLLKAAPKTDCFSLRFASCSVIYAMVLRFDDRLFFSNYLSSAVGDVTPFFCTDKSASAKSLYTTYIKEFEDAFEMGRQVSLKDLTQILEPHEQPALRGQRFPVVKQKTKFRDDVLGLRIDTLKSGKDFFFRKVVEYRRAAAIVAYRSDTNQVVLLDHYRHAVQRSLWEIPGGMQRDGEDPEDCVRRELLEEAGCEVRNLSPLVTYYPEPAFTTHEIVLYSGEVTRSDLRRNRDDHQEIAKEDMIMRREISSSWSVIALLLFMQRRLIR